ncbi:CU044_5270 family protein [Actinomadura rifamycini]|uniref:CU044_5270 family protein n=1 Tax=Actinomadura rifamycini TaxID=31962 RepID=UPI00042123B2|nr:CU044_5270 family protein [Actinomadura rifamycini]
MDEMKAIAEMLNEPPNQRTEDEGRRRLRREIADPSAGRRARTRFGWPLKAGLGIVAAGAAAAVAVSAVGTGTAPAESPEAGAPQGEIDLGRQAVLVAAENAAKQETGKYFFTDHVSGQSYVVPAETGAYAIDGARSATFVAAGLEPGDDVTFYEQFPGPRMWSPQDGAAWKKAGSPSKIKVWSSDKWLTFDMAEKAPWKLDGTNTQQEWLGKYTLEKLRNLPTDPEKLAAEVFDGTTPEAGRIDASGGKLPAHMKTEEFVAASKIRAVGWRLSDLPVPPKVRAALMKALMAQPGVRAVGETTDPLGRKGVALTSGSRSYEVTGEFGTPPEQQGTYSSRQEIVFDKATGNALAMQEVLTEPGGPYKDRKPGFIINYTAIRDTGWSDTEPTPPRNAS